MDLENKVALVTGAASEIGRAYVKYLFLNKVKVNKSHYILRLHKYFNIVNFFFLHKTVTNLTQVLLCDLQVEKCQLIANEFLKEFGNINAHTMKCDVTNRNEFESKDPKYYKLLLFCYFFDSEILILNIFSCANVSRSIFCPKNRFQYERTHTSIVIDKVPDFH